MQLLRKLFRVEDVAREELLSPVQPDQPLLVVGDVHGRDDLLAALLEKLHARSSTMPGTKTIFVGDYIDRGEESAQVLRRLHNLTQGADDVLCLMGNHERMMLDFLDDPVGSGPRWMRHGGLQTLASFGIGGVRDTSEDAALGHAANQLSAALGPQLLAWITELPLDWSSGNVVVTHAALDPELPPSVQSDRCKLWGHPDFMRKPRRDGIWVAHGHVIVDMPTAAQSRISVDTGAVFTGRLTAALLRPNAEPEFLQA